MENNLENITIRLLKTKYKGNGASARYYMLLREYDHRHEVDYKKIITYDQSKTWFDKRNRTIYRYVRRYDSGVQ